MARDFRGERWTRQPQMLVPLSPRVPMMSTASTGLVMAWEASGTALRNLVGAPSIPVETIGAGVRCVGSRYGQALRFDGTQASGAASFQGDPMTSGLNGSTEFTVEALVRNNGTGGAIISCWNSGNSFSSFLCSITSSGQLLFGPGQTSVAYILQSTETPLVAGPWRHVVFQWRATATLQVFVDGIEIAMPTTIFVAGTLLNLNSNGLEPIQLGRQVDSAPFDGDIAYCRIWRRYLTDQERPKRPNWDIFQRRRGYIYDLPVTSGFNPAWARGSNQLIGSGLYAS